MKKLLAMLLAAATACSVAVTSFAQTTDNTTPELFLGADTDGVVLGEETILIPGEDYQFPLMVRHGKSEKPLDNETAAQFNIRLESVKGKSSLDSVKVIKGKENHSLEIKVKAGWPTKQTEVEYALKLIDKKDSGNSMSTDIAFKTGYGIASDSSIANLGAGDEINVDNNAPIYTTEQLEKIAKANNYKKVTFTNGDWQYTVNVTDMESINMLNNVNSIKEVITAFPEHDFKFLSFPAGTQFSKGELKIDVADISEDFEGKFFVYRYYKGVMNKLDATYSADEDMISVPVGTLGRFVISDKEIKDGTVVEEGFGGSDNSSKPEDNTSKPEGDNNTPNKPNPDTGVGAVPAVAAVATLISLAGAAVVSKKRR